jgi:hypothetical protein
MNFDALLSETDYISFPDFYFSHLTFQKLTSHTSILQRFTILVRKIFFKKFGRLKNCRTFAEYLLCFWGNMEKDIKYI